MDKLGVDDSLVQVDMRLPLGELLELDDEGGDGVQVTLAGAPELLQGCEQFLDARTPRPDL